MSEFEEFLEREGRADSHQDLPCCHTTSAINFIGVLRSKTLRQTLCNVFNRYRLYFFYGRPSYRLSPKEKEQKLFEYLPVCFVIHWSDLKIDGAAAFDTGAWEHITEHVTMHKGQKKENFLLEQLPSIKRLIDFFFASNYRYFEGKVKPFEKDHLMIDFDANTYLKILNTDEGEIDNRVKTIELHVERDLVFPETPISTIIVPERFLSHKAYGPLLRDIVSQDRSRILTYTPTDLKMTDYHSDVNSTFRDYLKEQKMI